MAVYYKFKSAKDYDSVPVVGPFVSLAHLKEMIFRSKRLERGTDFDLVVTNAQTNEEYVGEETMIPKNTSVLIRRVPGPPRKPISTKSNELKVVEDSVEDLSLTRSTLVPDASDVNLYELPDFGDFGDDIYTTTEVASKGPKEALPNLVTTDKTEEERKIKALVDTPAIDWNSQKLDLYGSRRSSQHFMAKRMTTGVNFGRVGLERMTPPSGYVCHRCNVPGHFIQHCPTNGDPAYDIKRLKPPTGIPQSMLAANPDGSYALPGGAVAVLKPNEAAFDKEIEGLPTTCSADDLPVELHCPLCKRVMTDAVLTSKCCFGSFCDKCIREYILSRSMCICGATNILADDLVPNKTLRDTIINMVVSRSSSKSTSTDNSQSRMQIQDVESACCVKPEAPPTLSAAPNIELKQNSVEDSPSTKEGNKIEPDSKSARKSPEKAAETIDLLESTSQPMSGTKSKSQHSAATSVVLKKKVLNSEQGKKKKKKTNLAESDYAAVNMQWSGISDIGAGNWVNFPVHHASYNHYWASGGFPGGFDAYGTQFMASVPYTGYPSVPGNVLVGNILPQGSYGMQGYSSVAQSRGGGSRNGEIDAANAMQLKHVCPTSHRILISLLCTVWSLTVDEPTKMGRRLIFFSCCWIFYLPIFMAGIFGFSSFLFFSFLTFFVVLLIYCTTVGSLSLSLSLSFTWSTLPWLCVLYYDVLSGTEATPLERGVNTWHHSEKALS